MQISDHVDQVCKGLFPNLDFEVVDSDNVQGLPARPVAEPRCFEILVVELCLRFFTQAGDVNSSVIQDSPEMPFCKFMLK